MRMAELAKAGFDLKEPQFRKMRLDDIPVIYEIEQEAFPTPWSEGAFHNELTNNHFAHYVVMELDEAIIGYAGMWIIIDEAHVTNIAVRSGYRGRGLGERMLLEMQAMAVCLGAERMTLEVRVSNVIAQRLYSKMALFRRVCAKGITRTTEKTR